MQKEEWSEWDKRHRRQSCEGSSERMRATSEFQKDLRDRTKAFALRIVRRFLFRPSRFQLRSYLVIFRLRQLSPWRGSSRRFPSERGYDVKMGMVNGLAAAEPVILLNSETRCSQPILLRDRRFLNRDQKVTHLVRLEIQQISCAQTLWNHQNMARCDDLIRPA